MSNGILTLVYDIPAMDMISAGEASSNVKKKLKQLGVNPLIVKKVSISMYEAEMNAVIHANGGSATVNIGTDEIVIIIEDRGPGIENIDLAMKEGYSTASDEVRQMGFGAGMGLPNIKKNSDSLNIESEIGKGTRLEIAIKLTS